MMADAKQTELCTYLSAILLTGLLLNAWLAVPIEWLKHAWLRWSGITLMLLRLYPFPCQLDKISSSLIIGFRSRKAIVLRRFLLMSDKDLYSGMIRLHILYHATKEPIFGQYIIEELARHGYKLSPGTLYPILHGMETRGYLRSKERRDGRQTRRFYRATPAGRKALKSAKQKVRELVGELFEEE
jgi:DNA-binding PadR family transcriptional regulator